jgi:hypothetical protein
MQRQVGDSQIKQGKMSQEIFYEKVAKELFVNAVQKLQAQGQTKRPASTIVGREQFIYIIPVTHATLEGKYLCDVCAERTNNQTGKKI